MTRYALTPNMYTIVTRAVDEGIRHGLRRYAKYADDILTDVETDALYDHIEREVMNALSEVIDFAPEEET